jgi:hypothetical protein
VRRLLVTIIHGTATEVTDLQRALASNCTCDPAQGKRCASCRAASEDQQWLDRMLFIRRIRVRLWDEECLAKKGDVSG